MLQRIPKEETWVSFMEISWELPQNVKVLIIEKIHGNMKTFCIQHKSLIINASKLTKYRQWLPILNFKPILLIIENVYTKYHLIKLLDCREFDKVNINTLIEKWMLCDTLWVSRRKQGGY
jgi:hypothetical protein